MGLGINIAVLDAYVRGAGMSQRITAVRFNQELQGWPTLHLNINRYVHLQMSQLAQNVLCSRFHELDARMALWLLMTHDRVRSNSFNVTHKSLADSLGMRSSGVTVEVGRLQSRGYIDHSRGHITMLNRAGLEAQPCECYAKASQNYDRLFK